ncbi:unnamed protein product, partial [Iphiclides podalirius]
MASGRMGWRACAALSTGALRNAVRSPRPAGVLSEKTRYEPPSIQGSPGIGLELGSRRPLAGCRAIPHLIQLEIGPTPAHPWSCAHESDPDTVSPPSPSPQVPGRYAWGAPPFRHHPTSPHPYQAPRYAPPIRFHPVACSRFVLQ